MPNPLVICLLSFSAIFTFAFGMAWFMPLVAARNEVRKEEATAHDTILTGADILLLIMDCFPFFWIFRTVGKLPELPAAAREVREIWQAEPSIRRMFHAWLVSLGVLLLTILFGIF
ncbi:hypothetical protein OVA24_08500 [Luteolibacter sp. SL250]|uniref:hypothetical protein n=1 Tax=Luteolibacter sp. SL250 TaxID=2995170 RepID=UPI00226D9930|nr:hypothetical protein [Luteolibacter sp. SL250]WAC21425.1 hypothetical protein OVA24_08500 [Luteolibacter sp. SL250]